MLKLPISIKKEDVAVIGYFVVAALLLFTLLRYTTSVSDEQVLRLLENQQCTYYVEITEYYYFEDGQMEKGEFESRGFNSYDAASMELEKTIEDYNICDPSGADTVRFFLVEDCELDYRREEVMVLTCNDQPAGSGN